MSCAADLIQCPIGTLYTAPMDVSAEVRAETCVDVAGRKQGPFRLWANHHGTLPVEGTYRDGFPDGVVRHYDEEGVLTNENLYAAGALITLSSPHSLRCMPHSTMRAPKRRPPEKTGPSCCWIDAPSESSTSRNLRCHSSLQRPEMISTAGCVESWCRTSGSANYLSSCPGSPDFQSIGCARAGSMTTASCSLKCGCSRKNAAIRTPDRRAGRVSRLRKALASVAEHRKPPIASSHPGAPPLGVPRLSPPPDHLPITVLDNPSATAASAPTQPADGRAKRPEPRVISSREPAQPRQMPSPKQNLARSQILRHTLSDGSE